MLGVCWEVCHLSPCPIGSAREAPPAGSPSPSASALSGSRERRIDGEGGLVGEVGW